MLRLQDKIAPCLLYGGDDFTPEQCGVDFRAGEDYIYTLQPSKGACCNRNQARIELFQRHTFPKDCWGERGSETGEAVTNATGRRPSAHAHGVKTSDGTGFKTTVGADSRRSEKGLTRAL